ncbi:MAG TPA: hypothetical protein VGE36_01375 [Roseateles sp.]
MASIQAWSLVGSLLLGALLGGGAVLAWLSRRMKLVQQRLEHVEHTRQQGAQQLTQARKQIEQLQKDCHELRLAVRPAARPAPAPVVPEDPAEAVRRHAEALLNPAARLDPTAQAFKDTVVLKRGE